MSLLDKLCEIAPEDHFWEEPNYVIWSETKATIEAEDGQKFEVRVRPKEIGRSCCDHPLRPPEEVPEEPEEAIPKVEGVPGETILQVLKRFHILPVYVNRLVIEQTGGIRTKEGENRWGEKVIYEKWDRGCDPWAPSPKSPQP